jgi:pimeloyl-ACP methyl ester carboxylesterase
VEPLASQFRAVTYDRRGHSRSERSSEQGSAEQDAADLIELVERLDLAPVFVVGNSSGALITLRVAATRPDLLRGLSIHEPPGLALLADEPQMRPLLEGVGERISGVRVLLEDGKYAAARSGRFAGIMPAQSWWSGTGSNCRPSAFQKVCRP